MYQHELSPAERERAIQGILNQGLRQPKGLWAGLWELLCALGPGNLFFGTALAAGLTLAANLAAVWLCGRFLAGRMYAALFAMAPASFLLILLFTEAAEQLSGCYPLKMTCKYTLRQVTACRVLAFSLLGTVSCTLGSLYYVNLFGARSLLQPLSISLCGLFLCVALSLLFLRRFQGPRAPLFMAALWMAVSLLPPALFGQDWEALLAQLPAAVTAGTAAAAWVLSLLELKWMLNTPGKEASRCAAC